MKMGLMIDCSRDGVYKIDFLKKYIPLFNKLGYNAIELYTEDTYCIKGKPYFGYLRGAYTESELKEFVSFAQSYDVEVIPCIQTLAHLNCLLELPIYSKYKDVGDIILADSDETYALVEDMIKQLRDVFQSNNINIGMDEAPLIGMGTHLSKFGYETRNAIMQRHLSRVATICEKYSFSPTIWSDMLFSLDGDVLKDEELNENCFCVPKNVKLCYWDYYHLEEGHYAKMINFHKSFNREISFAGGGWTWTGFAPNNTHAYNTFSKAISECKKGGIDELYLTLWGDNGTECPLRSALPSIFTFAGLINGKAVEEIKEEFKCLIDVSFDDFMLLEKINNIGKNKVLIQNPCKYMLYNDIFLGKFDSTVEKNDGKEFLSIAKQLKSVDSKEYGDIFDMEYKLASVLSIKCDIGLKIRKAYKEKDICELSKLIKKLKKVKKLTMEFKESFEKCWSFEKKMCGYEIHEARLSGLIGRIDYCIRKLKLYIDGKISDIEELGLEILDYEGNGKIAEGQKIVFNDYRNNITTGIM